MVYLTRAQRLAVKKLYIRFGEGVTYKAFRRLVEPGYGYVGICVAGMYIGIEPNGYTHT